MRVWDLRRRAPSRRLWNWRLSPLALAVIGLLVFGAQRAASASQSLSSHRPEVLSFAVSPATRSAAGGPATISDRVVGASQCSVSSTPALAGLPAMVPCASGSVSVTIPADTGSRAQKYRLTLVAMGSKTVKAKLTLVVPAVGAPTISGFHASSANLSQGGGSLDLTATVTGARSCTVSSSPTLVGLPATTPCSSGLATKVTLPANDSAKLKRYKFTLRALGSKTTRAPKLTVSVAGLTTSGSVSVLPASVLPSTATQVSFAYTVGTGGMSSGLVSVIVPSGWSPPTPSPGNPGYTTASAGTLSVTGRVITVSGLTAKAGTRLGIFYGTGLAPNAAVSASTPGTYAFTVQEKSTARSNPTTLSPSPSITVRQPPPANTVPPSITGYASVGLTLTAEPGTWQNSPTSLSYGWQLCTASGTGCSAIAGANGTTYTVTSQNSGLTVAVSVTAANAHGSSTVQSSPTAVVTAPGACPEFGSTDNWTGGAGTLNWADGGNWSRGSAPTSSDFACLPTDTPGSGTISLPNVSVRRLLSFKSLSISSGFTTAAGADLEADVAWSGGAIAGSTLTIGSTSTVTISGPVSLSNAVYVNNLGSVRVTSGVVVTVYSGTSWVNRGTFTFADSTGSAVNVGGQFINFAGGTVTKTGTAVGDSVYGGGQVENDGTVSVPGSGTLVWTSQSSALPTQPAPGDGISDGTFTGSSTGTVDLGFPTQAGYNWVSSKTTFGNGVIVTSILTGSFAVPAGVTLTEGGSTAINNETIIGTVSGAGTLAIDGYGTSYYTTYSATFKGDLMVANVTLNNAILVPKLDASATVIGSSTVVDILSTPSLGSNLVLDNYGTMNFGSNSYFACGTCSFINEVDASLEVNNPDGSFLHSFNIQSGNFDNQGVILETGYLPGTAITFGSNEASGAGQGEFDDLQEPSWVPNLSSGSAISTLGGYLSVLGANPTLLVPLTATNLGVPGLTNMGVGSCGSASLSIGVAGASVGVCEVMDSTGDLAVELEVSASVGFSSDSWSLSNIFPGVNASADAGAIAYWDSTGGQFSVTNDLGGPAWCETATFKFFVGGIAQHCWSPSNQKPFDLNANVITQPGVHSLYGGISIGAGFGLSGSLSYSVVLSCAALASDYD